MNPKKSTIYLLLGLITAFGIPLVFRNFISGFFLLLLGGPLVIPILFIIYTLILSPSLLLMLHGVKLRKGYSTIRDSIIILLLVWASFIAGLVIPRETHYKTYGPPNVVEYHITNLGLKFNLPSELSDLTYVIVKLPDEQAVGTVGFSNKELETLGCLATTGPLGYLTYQDDQGGELVGHVRNSNLYFIKPDGRCLADPSLQNWQLLRDSLKSLTSDYVPNQ